MVLVDGKGLPMGVRLESASQVKLILRRPRSPKSASPGRTAVATKAEAHQSHYFAEKQTLCTRRFKKRGIELDCAVPEEQQTAALPEMARKLPPLQAQMDRGKNQCVARAVPPSCWFVATSALHFLYASSTSHASGLHSGAFWRA